MQNRIAAGIVLYNPDIDRLKKNLEVIESQVEKVFLVDNHSNNLEEVKKMIKIFSYNCPLSCRIAPLYNGSEKK